MNEIEVSWAAGLFDGEGSVGAYTSGRNHYLSSSRKYPKVTVSNTDKYLLDRFQNAVGIGKIYGPKVSKNPRWSARYDYRLDGYQQVMTLFTILGPYLSPVKYSNFETALAQYSNWQRDEFQKLGSVGSNPT